MVVQPRFHRVLVSRLLLLLRPPGAGAGPFHGLRRASPRARHGWRRARAGVPSVGGSGLERASPPWPDWGRAGFEGICPGSGPAFCPAPPLPPRSSGLPGVAGGAGCRRSASSPGSDRDALSQVPPESWFSGGHQGAPRAVRKPSGRD